MARKHCPASEKALQNTTIGAYSPKIQDYKNQYSKIPQILVTRFCKAFCYSGALCLTAQLMHQGFQLKVTVIFQIQIPDGEEIFEDQQDKCFPECLMPIQNRRQIPYAYQDRFTST